MVETTQDIFEEIRHFDAYSETHVKDLTETQTISREIPLYNLIDYAPISIEEIILQSGLTADKVSSILIDMELKGLIVETSSGYQRVP